MHIAECLHQRFPPRIDVGYLTAIVERESNRGFFVPGVVNNNGVVKDDLRDRVELLHLDSRWYRHAGRRLKMRHIDGVLAGHDSADRDYFLADRRRNFLAVHEDKIVGAAAVVSLEHHKARFAMSIPSDVAGWILHKQVEIIGV